MQYDTHTMIDIEIYRFLKTANLGELTGKTYRTYIERFYWYCQDNKIDPDKADAIHVHEWFKTKPHWSNSTQVYASASLRAFYSWKYGKAHPMMELKIKKRKPPPQRTLTGEEVLQVMASLDNSTYTGIRNLALITLMVDTGLRASEVCNVLLSKMDLKSCKLQVLIKGGEWGEAAYFDYTQDCIHRWLAIRPFVADPTCEYLICSIGGKVPGKKMTRYGLRSTLERICKRAGVHGVSPHVMRRTFATLATENGAPSRLLQVAGRWKDIRMVETYTRTLQAEKIRPYSVVNRLMGLTTKEPDSKT